MRRYYGWNPEDLEERTPGELKAALDDINKTPLTF